MNVPEVLFEIPRFRPGVRLRRIGEDIDIDYRNQGCTVDVPEESRELTWSLMVSLQEGIPTENLFVLFPALSGQIPGIIRDLDRLGLLEEVHDSSVAPILSGDAFYREIRNFVARSESRICSSALFRALQNGQATREILIRYVLEYFHVVHASPAILGQIMAHRGNSTTYRILREYFLAECSHDELLQKSLKTVDVDPLCNGLLPLRSTFAILSALWMFARQDPLSFKSVLFLLERPQQEFHTAFRSCCISVGLPSAFYDPVMEHSGINDQGSHEEITKLLLHEIHCVSQEESTTVKKNLYHLIECLENLEGQILCQCGPVG